jgi:eukaryotic-like serine/threonine-protein kinase
MALVRHAPDTLASPRGGTALNPAFSLPQPATSLVGRIFGGRYLLREVVAEGGMATVYRAKQVLGGSDVAIKVMHPHLTRDRDFAQRFRREAVIAGRLTHPGVVRVMGHGAEGPLFFLVMELLSGQDLFDVLRRHGRLDAAVARRVVIEVCDALGEPHSQGIVHRDLKPENVFLTRTGEGALAVKILDFGVAKMMLREERADGEHDSVLTAMGAILGTPEYISPEMCRGEAVGLGADLYACGILLYALLTGRPPFVTERPLDVTIKHILDVPRPPSELVPGLDPALDAVILQALAKHPEERQSSAGALADALRALGPVPPLDESLLGDTSQATVPPPALRHSTTSATLAHAVTVSLPSADDDLSRPSAVSLPLVAAPLPVPSRSPTRAPAATSSTRWALAGAVLLATFVAGVAVGRWTAPVSMGGAPTSSAARQGQSARP